MTRITMRKVQETKLSEVFSLYLASAAAKGVKDKTLKTYEQHFNAISKRLNMDSYISLTTSTPYAAIIFDQDKLFKMGGLLTEAAQHIQYSIMGITLSIHSISNFYGLFLWKIPSCKTPKPLLL